MMRLTALLLLTGCPWIGPETHDDNFDDTDDDTVITGDFVINSVKPDYGPTGAATEITLFGGEFEPEDTEAYDVFIGGERARILDVQEDSITVDVPVRTTPGSVDIELVDDDDTALLADGFRYFTNQQGLAGLVGGIDRWEHVNTNWPLRTTDNATAFIGFAGPDLEFSPWSFQAPRLDACQNGYADGIGGLLMDDESIEIVNADGVIVDLARDTSGASAYFGPVPFAAADDVWDLSQIMGGPDIPSVGISPAFAMPNAMDLTLPNATANGVLHNSFYVEWDSIGQVGDFVLINVDVYDSSWGTLIEHVSCAAIDDGRFRISPTVFTQWASGNNIHMSIGRARTVGGTFPHNLSLNQTTATNWTVAPVIQR